MPKLIALEWDGHEARVVVARGSGRNIVVEQAFAIQLMPRDPGQTFADTNIGERIATDLAARGVGRAETLVAVGRASIELRVLNVPPTPEEELPDLVRFQAMRQFTTLGDDWPLDFVVLDETPEGSSVLAAAISPELVQQIRETCAAGDLAPARLVLRPFATASLLRRKGIDDRCCLMVDLLADEADLTVLVDQHVAFMRTVRLPATDDVAQVSRALRGEIRRTIVAAQNQLGGRRVEQVVLCGVQDYLDAISSMIQEQLSLSVDHFHPFDAVQVDSRLRQQPPEHPGRYASLLGMLSDEASGVAHTIDFLHPRKRPEPPSTVGRNSLIGICAAAALLAVIAAIWIPLRIKDAELRGLRARTASLQQRVQRAQVQMDRVAVLDEWVEGDINWLDELRELSDELPSAEQTIVTQLAASALQSGGRLTVTGAVKDSQVIASIERAIRDAQHDVRGRGATPFDNIDQYNQQYTEILTIKPPSQRVPANQADAEEAAPAANPPQAESSSGQPADASGETPAATVEPPPGGPPPADAQPERPAVPAPPAAQTAAPHNGPAGSETARRSPQ